MESMGGSTLKTYCAVAAFALSAGTYCGPAMADDAPASSGPSCEIGEQLPMKDLSPKQIAAKDALFMKLCMESNGALVNGDDLRLVHNLTKPGKFTGRGAHEFYPSDAEIRGQRGSIFVTYVVEIDGRTTSPTVIRSSGYTQLDKAALEFIGNITYKSPAYLDFTPVRIYTAMIVDFRIG